LHLFMVLCDTQCLTRYTLCRSLGCCQQLASSQFKCAAGAERSVQQHNRTQDERCVRSLLRLLLADSVAVCCKSSMVRLG
jgi:hypothetical protein